MYVSLLFPTTSLITYVKLQFIVLRLMSKVPVIIKNQNMYRYGISFILHLVIILIIVFNVYYYYIYH